MADIKRWTVLWKHRPIRVQHVRETVVENNHVEFRLTTIYVCDDGFSYQSLQEAKDHIEQTIVQEESQ